MDFTVNEAVKLFEEIKKDVNVNISVDYFYGANLKMYQNID